MQWGENFKVGVIAKAAAPRVAAVFLLAALAALAGSAAFRESVAMDELAHIGAGVSYWQKLDLRMNMEHLPLVKLLAAAPLVALGAHADYRSEEHTSELQSLRHLVWRLLPEKQNGGH